MATFGSLADDPRAYSVRLPDGQPAITVLVPGDTIESYLARTGFTLIGKTGRQAEEEANQIPLPPSTPAGGETMFNKPGGNVDIGSMKPIMPYIEAQPQVADSFVTGAPSPQSSSNMVVDILGGFIEGYGGGGGISGGIQGGINSLLQPGGGGTQATGCPEGYTKVGSSCVDLSSMLPGGKPGVVPEGYVPADDAISEILGVPGKMPTMTQRRTCGPGMVLLENGKCYPKGLKGIAPFRASKPTRRNATLRSMKRNISAAAAAKKTVEKMAKDVGLHVYANPRRSSCKK